MIVVVVVIEKQIVDIYGTFVIKIYLSLRTKDNDENLRSRNDFLSLNTQDHGDSLNVRDYSSLQSLGKSLCNIRKTIILKVFTIKMWSEYGDRNSLLSGNMEYVFGLKKSELK